MVLGESHALSKEPHDIRAEIRVVVCVCVWAGEAEFKQCGNGSAMNVDLDIGRFRAGPKSGFFENLLGRQAVSSIYDDP